MRMIMIEVDYQPEFSQKSPRFSIYQFPFAKPPNLLTFSIPLISMYATSTQFLQFKSQVIFCYRIDFRRIDCRESVSTTDF